MDQPIFYGVAATASFPLTAPGPGSGPQQMQHRMFGTLHSAVRFVLTLQPWQLEVATIRADPAAVGKSLLDTHDIRRIAERADFPPR